MTDIVKRLEHAADADPDCPILGEAKAEIERLTHERDEWKEKWMALARAALTVRVLENKP